MAAGEQSQVVPFAPSRRFVIALLAGMAALLSALITIPILAFTDSPLWVAPIIPMAVFGAIIFLWNTQYGLYFAAFAIGPLGVVQQEILTVTLNLPEVLILALVIKEALRFLLRGEQVVDFLPARTLVLYLGVSVLGILTGIMRGNPLVAVLQDFRQYSEYIALYLLVLHRVSTRREVIGILVAFLIGMTLLGAHGILQRFTGLGIPANQILSDLIHHAGIRGGSFYGSTPLGAMMVLAVAVTAGLGLSTRSKLQKVVLGAIAAVCLSSAVFTSTRASWIAIAVCLLFIFFSIRKTAAFLMLSAAAIVIFFATLGPLVIQRMEKIEISKREQSLLERVQYYTAAWHIFRAYPILGLGWGCEFSVRDINIHGRYVPPPPRPYALNRAIFGESTVHSAYLQILVRIGLLGLIPFLLLLWQWVKLLFRERTIEPRNERDHNLFVGVCGGMVGYLAHASLENFFQWPVMSQSFWLLLGLTTVMAARLIQHGAIEPDMASPSRPETQEAGA